MYRWRMSDIGAHENIDKDIRYHQTSNKSPTLVGNTIFDHSDVVRASPVGAAPITSSF